MSKISLTITIILLMIFLLYKNKQKSSVILLFSSSLLLITGIITEKSIIRGFSNEGMITVAFLFIISESINNSKEIDWISNKILNKEDKPAIILLKLFTLLVVISAFLNNTPIAAILLVILKRWSIENNKDISKLLMPMCFFISMGGMSTLIGTSTNMLISQLFISNGYDGLTMFGLTKEIMIINTMSGMFIILLSGKLLKNNAKLKNAKSIETKSKKIECTLFLIMILLVSLSVISMLYGVIILTSILFMFKKIDFNAAIKSIDFNTLVVIAISFSIGDAIINSGLSELISEWISSVSSNILVVLIVIYIINTIFTNIMTNNAAAVLSFHIFLMTIKDLDIEWNKFMLVLIVSSSASYMTPFGYQTNLMIQENGGYRLKDYLTVGGACTLITMVMTILFILQKEREA